MEAKEKSRKKIACGKRRRCDTLKMGGREREREMLMTLRNVYCHIEFEK